MLVKKQIYDILLNGLKTVAPDSGDVEIELTRPQRAEFGDFSTNVLFGLAKRLGEDVGALGDKLLSAISAELEKADTPIGKVERVNGGFINFFLKNEYYLDRLSKRGFTDLESFGARLSGQRIVVEYTDPNPFKAFHIGHLMTNTIGEAISRLLEVAGADVKRLNYQGDVGMHVAKSIWGMRKKLTEGNRDLAGLSNAPLGERISFLGESYALGAKAYSDNEIAKREVEDLNTLVYVAAQERLIEKENWRPRIRYKDLFSVSEKELAWVMEYYEKGREWSLEHFEEVYSLLGTKFDAYYFESKVGDRGLEIVKAHVDDGVFEESEGAIVFKGEKRGLHTRVFVNKRGLPVYEAKDLALAIMKYEDFSYDQSFIITANEIDEYFKVVLAALGEISPDVASKTVHIGHGMLRLPSGKMSSRTGKVITGMDLIEKIKEAVSEIVGQDRDLADGEKEDVVDTVSVGAWKYSVLKQQIGNDIVFDLGKSVSLEGKSGPYLQYTYARAKSVLKKIGTRERATFGEYDVSEKERELLRKLDSYEEVLSEAAGKCAPHILALYLYDLAQVFNSFYNDSQILADDENVRAFRIGLTASTADVLRHGLHTLGIGVVERM